MAILPADLSAEGWNSHVRPCLRSSVSGQFLHLGVGIRDPPSELVSRTITRFPAPHGHPCLRPLLPTPYRPTPNPAHAEAGERLTHCRLFSASTPKFASLSKPRFQDRYESYRTNGTWGRGPCQFIRFYNLARSGRKRLRRWAKLLMLPASGLTPADASRRARSSPCELLQRRNSVSGIQLACWKPRSADKTSAARLPARTERRDVGDHRQRQRKQRRMEVRLGRRRIPYVKGSARRWRPSCSSLKRRGIGDRRRSGGGLSAGPTNARARPV